MRKIREVTSAEAVQLLLTEKIATTEIVYDSSGLEVGMDIHFFQPISIRLPDLIWNNFNEIEAAFASLRHAQLAQGVLAIKDAVDGPSEYDNYLQNTYGMGFDRLSREHELKLRARD